MGVTVNEWLNRERYEYIRNIRGLYLSEFSLGWLNNFKAFFFKNAPSHYVWDIPKTHSQHIRSFISGYEKYMST